LTRYILEHGHAPRMWNPYLVLLTKAGTSAEQIRTKAMSRTQTPVGPGRRHEVLNDPHGRSQGGRTGRRWLSLIVGGILSAVALVFVAGGGLALWKDRVDRDGQGFVSFGTEQLRTGQYAIVGELRGDGPRWLYGSTVLGDARIRATSGSEEPLFVGIARKDDVLRYLHGAGYATIYGFEVTADTTHPGEAPSGPPASESIWAASTQGDGQQSLWWTPRDGVWSVVFMNADAGAEVDVRGDASAKLPALPWIAGGLLTLGAVSGLVGSWVLVRAGRRGGRSARPSGSASSRGVTA
jgi:hypothetical protein